MDTTNGDVPGSGVGSISGGNSGSSSRWNPTKEQLSMLEGLYGQGIRTPSAEQIQSITKKLQVYGHIEGKNVFYWFQNHKARQRQKQKMDQMNSANNSNININNVVVNGLKNNNAASYFNRVYYPSAPVSPSGASSAGSHYPLFQAAPYNVSYTPYYVAQPEFGFYPHCPRMMLSNHLVNNSQIPTHVHQNINLENTTYTTQSSSNTLLNSAHLSNGLNEESGNVTLNLFPLHPTGILRDRNLRSPSIGSSTENSLENSLQIKN